MEHVIKKIDKDLDGLVFIQKNDKEFAVKVPFSSLGEIVEIKKIDYKNSTPVATDFSILKQASTRVTPDCKYFGSCGGCKGQHFKPEEYLDFKMANLRQLMKIHNLSYDKEIAIYHHLDQPLGQRRRSNFSVENSKIGFKAYRSNFIIDMDYCLLLTPSINKVFQVFKKVVSEYHKYLNLQEVLVTDIDGNLDVLLKSTQNIDNKVIEALQEVFKIDCLKRIFWQKRGSVPEPLIIKEDILLNYDNYQVPFSSGGFIQAERFGEEEIKSLLHKCLDQPKRILDLFCGFGAYSFSFLEDPSVEMIEAVDISEDSIKAINKYKNIRLKASLRDIFKEAFNSSYLDNFDSVIINPPRSGAKEQIIEMAKSSLQQIAMVYCSPQSIIRDCSYLIQNSNFKIKNISVIDQFIYSPHIEIFIYLENQS